MKTAVVGSTGITVPDLENYLPPQTTEIISDGVNGVCISAKKYAMKHGIKYAEFPPEYEISSHSAALKRNTAIIEYADIVLVFWDGKNQCTKSLIDKCNEMGVPIRVFV